MPAACPGAGDEPCRVGLRVLGLWGAPGLRWGARAQVGGISPEQPPAGEMRALWAPSKDTGVAGLAWHWEASGWALSRSACSRVKGFVIRELMSPAGRQLALLAAPPVQQVGS